MTVLALAGVLVLQLTGPALAEVFPPALQRTLAAMDPAAGPDQQWGSAADANGADGAANKADPLSLQAKYPPIKGQEPVAKDNPVAVETKAAESVRGFDAATSKEIADRRSEKSRTFANPDGTETTQFSEEPLNHRKPDGSWTPIDPTLVPAGAEGWRNSSDSVDVRFAPTTVATPLVRYALDGDHEFGFSLQGAARSVGQPNGAEITYPAVRPQVDLKFEVRAGAVKESIVLHSPDTPRTFDFPLHLKGLQAKASDEGIELLDRDGKRRALIPTGFMADSSDGPAGPSESRGVKYELVGQTLRVTLDDAWLKDPARRFPVLVDPTVTKFDASTMYVQRDSSGQNFAEVGTGELRAGTVVDKGVRINTASYLQFAGLENTLRNHKIFGAQLGITNWWSYSCSARSVSVHPVTTPWSPSKSHRYPGPSFGNELGTASFAYGFIARGASRSNCPQATARIDLGAGGRDLVQKWVTGQETNNGLTVRASETDEYGWKKFYDHTSLHNKPALWVTHTPYDAAYRIHQPVPKPTLLKGGQPGKIGITVTNQGATTWTPGEYVLSYRQFSNSGAPMLQVNDSAHLPHDVARGQTVTLEASITPPEDWGGYRLEFSMHRKGHAYFVDEQIPPAVLVFELQNVPPALQEQYPPNGYSAPSLRPTLWAKGTDIDNGGAGFTYRFKVCDKDSPDQCVDSGYNPSPSWTLPAGALRWSKTYLWNAFVKDSGGAESSPVQSSVLFTAVPQPGVTAHLGSAPHSGRAGSVDAQVGNYTTSAVDFSVPGAGPSLSLTRTYNSLNPRRDTLFGEGWTTQYDMKVTEDPDGTGNVVVHYGDGQRVRFGHNGGGTYAPPPGRYATLFRNEAGWTLVDKSASGYFFRPDGKLVRIADSSRRLLELTYDQDKLTTVSNTTSGRSIHFTYVGGFIKEATTQLGDRSATWSYGMSSSGVHQVCDPDSHCTKYDYGFSSHFRTNVLDDRPESYWTLGETTGDKAASQIGVNLAKDTATYVGVALGKPGVATGTPDTAAGFDGVQSRITLPDNVLRKNRNASVELWFRTTSSGPLLAFQDKEFSQAPGVKLPVLWVGTDGKLRGRLPVEGAAQPAPIVSPYTVNHNTWMHVVLSADVGSQKMYLQGDEIGKIDGIVDVSGLQRGQIGAGYGAGLPGWGSADRWLFNGDVDEVAVYAHPLGRGQVEAHRNSVYSNPQLTKVTLPSGRTGSEIRYDVVRDRVSEHIDNNGGGWKYGAPSFTGNEKNVVRTVRVTDPGNRNHYYDFDPLRGRILRYLSPLGVETRKEDRPPDAPTTGPSEPTCAPQPDGSFCDVPINGGAGGFVPVEFQGVRSFDYDDAGYQTTITDETGRQIEIKHDERGNVKSRRTCRGAANCQVAHYTYFFNPGDLTDPRNDRITEYRDARSANATDNTYRTTYAYDPQGHMLEQVTPDSAKVTHTYTTGSSAAFDGGSEPTGLVKVSRDARNIETRYTYYKNGDLAEVRVPTGARTQYQYDSKGRPAATKLITDKLPNGLATFFLYDSQSRLTRVTQPATTDAVTGKAHHRQTSTQYDADGNTTRVEAKDLVGDDPARVTTVDYDGRGRPERVVDAEGGETSFGYDAYGNRTWAVNANGVRTEIAYTARNAVAEVRLRGWNGDPEGAPALTDGYLVVQRNSYDRAGRLVRTTDAMQRTQTLEYYDDDLLRSKKLVAAATGGGAPPKLDLATYGYDAAGNLTEEKFLGGLVTKHEYDAVGRRTRTIDDPNGLARRTEVSYNLNGAVTKVLRAGNSSNMGGLQDSTPEIVEYGYDDANRQISESVVMGQSSLVSKWVYDQRGLVTKTIPPRGNQSGANPDAFATEYGYDVLGRLVTATGPSVTAETGGGTPSAVRPVVTRGYNTFGEPLSTKDEVGAVRRAEVDKLGRVVRSFDAPYIAPGTTEQVIGTSSVKYDGVGNVLEATDRRGAVTSYEYDQMNRLRKVTEPQPGGVWEFAYTRTGDPLSTVDPSGARTESTYDQFGRPATSTQLERFPSRTLTAVYGYDAAGRLATTKSPAGIESKIDYDAVGQAVKTTDGAGVATHYGYDMAGRLARKADAAGRATFSGYDQAGRLTSARTIGAGGGLISRSTYEYDADGNRTSVSDPDKRVTTFTYDALSRLTKQVEPVSATESITTSFGYDVQGRRTRYTDGRQNSTIYSYNTLGLLESTVEPSTGQHPNPVDRTWTTSYNAAGDPLVQRAPGGVVIERAFDALGQLKRESGTGAEAPTTPRAYDYDVLGRLISAEGVGGTDVYTYNDRGQMLTARGPGGDATREYDDDGRPVSRADASGTTTFTYDKGRTKSVRDGVTGVTQTLGYDAVGQLKTLDLGNGRTRTYDYDDAGRLSKDTVAGAASIGYTYDKAGRLATKTTTGTAQAGQQSYGYDFSGRLTSWTSGSGTVPYAWDGAGNRTRAGDVESTYDERNRLRTEGSAVVSHNARGGVVSRTGGSAAQFDAFDRLVKQGALTYSYDSLDRVGKRNGTAFRYNGMSTAVVNDGQSFYSRDADGSLLAVSQGADKRLAVADLHGDMVGTLDPAGTMSSLADSAAYDPFGKVTGTTGTKRTIGFQGEWTDPDSGSVNMAARWYNPGSGGFESRDSWALPSSPSAMANKYSYGASSPVNYVDPTGHTPGDLGWCMGPCGDPFGDQGPSEWWVCSLWPDFCSRLKDIFNPPPSDNPGEGSNCSGSRCGKCAGSNCGGSCTPGSGQCGGCKAGRQCGSKPDPRDKARQDARQFGLTNPLPVPEALRQPSYGHDRTPPVSSSPQMPSHLAGDFANPVEDLDKAYTSLYEEALAQRGPVIEDLSNALRSPIVMTSAGNELPPGCVYVSGSYAQCNGPLPHGNPDYEKYQYEEQLKDEQNQQDMHDLLDYSGMIPYNPLAPLSDLGNGIWYAAEDNWEEAWWSFGGAIPFIGDAGKGARKGIHALPDELLDGLGLGFAKKKKNPNANAGQPKMPPPNKQLSAFPGAKPAKKKTAVQGGGKLRERWKDEKGNIYEWDYENGTVEKYDKKGNHQGEFDPSDGRQTKPRKPGRNVEP